MIDGSSSTEYSRNSNEGYGFSGENTQEGQQLMVDNNSDYGVSNSEQQQIDAEGSSGTTAVNRSQAAFVNKLYKMLEDSSIHHLISWSQNGDLFSVTNPTSFSRTVLPQYFKHNNWQSFVRQLNSKCQPVSLF
ncbi:HSF-type DNA-binding-domain-containing protein [Zychaea mexicana]|uniref:HSF-type DNA-binding-domain-containing protein n=1 Tax=Zychaea mexicana TaxID=64656 RepID=UPI0022FE5269|nr:HSF-type DNA-binding-domain-containing protein [Zychaea mexicana]KAI9498878.1 HSF-type DNA-binding-domain-containing protein [Zychaea mexicana]